MTAGELEFLRAGHVLVRLGERYTYIVFWLCLR
jgi:hypothetical protein